MFKLLINIAKTFILIATLILIWNFSYVFLQLIFMMYDVKSVFSYIDFLII